MSTFQERFSLLVKELTESNSNAELAKKLGSENLKQQIGAYAKGDNLPNAKFLILLKTHFPNIDLNWLLTGKGDTILKKYKHVSNEESENSLGETEISYTLDKAKIKVYEELIEKFLEKIDVNIKCEPKP